MGIDCCKDAQGWECGGNKKKGGGIVAGNKDNLRPIDSTELARELQLKSAAKRKENREQRKLIKDRILERMGETDWDQMIDNLIARAMDDTKSFETLRDTIGEKPTDKAEIDSKVEIVMSDDLEDYAK